MFSGASTDYFDSIESGCIIFHCIQIINLKVGTNEKIRRAEKLETEFVVFFFQDGCQL